MDRLYVPLAPETLAALHQLAERHLRTQREEAAFLIVEGLRRRAHQVAHQRQEGERAEPPERDGA